EAEVVACAVSVSPAAYLPQPPFQVHPIFRSTPQIPRDFRMSDLIFRSTPQIPRDFRMSEVKCHGYVFDSNKMREGQMISLTH
ncbi:MAG: hypothetical protein ACYCPD_01175, partial [Acidobacteriaceae bacterium]